ncbi:AAA family ATPase [Sorangium sp. So ce388]|uniref:AAA family ATPase n=1 Tax=Sorangium sp. So ce388 TaxID=3133309 RepID=UPI003F5CBAF6
MNKGIKLLRLSVQDVGNLVGRFDLGPFSAGINVISGRNEAGKSTLVRALRAALFERHDSENQHVQSLRTRGTRNAPEIWVELELGGERVSVHKRFLERPVADVRLHRDNTEVHGASAEEMLLSQLEGRRPGKRDRSRNHMGLWGLLWVAQDESASADPGGSLDEHVRGALSDVIGRQVGQVLGGKHGERLRTRVIEHAALFINARGPTGEYRAAQDRLRTAEERVKAIAAAKVAVEELARTHAELSEQLRDAERKLPELERELEAAVAAERRVSALEESARDAAALVATTEARCQAAQREVEARAALAGEATELDAAIAAYDEDAAALARAIESAEREAASAREDASSTKGAALQARAALDAAVANLDRLRRRDEATRVVNDLRAAEEVAAELAEASRRLETETLDERLLEEIEVLTERAKAVRARLDAEGTRIVALTADGRQSVHAVGAASTIDVPGLGRLEIEPARPGLAQALAEAEKQRAALEEALRALGVADVAAARASSAARAGAAREYEALGALKKKLAPKGLDALELRVNADRAQRVRIESALDEAMRAERDREESVRALAAHRVDEEAMDALRVRERDVAVQRASCDAIATRVEVRALADLRVRLAGAQEARRVKAGSCETFTSAIRTTVVLEDVAEITLEPRGKDLAKSRAALERSERELSAMLQALEVADLEGAAQAARAWTQLDAVREQAEERLAKAAPDGIEALRGEAEKARRRGISSEKAFAEAREAFASHARIEVALAQNPITGEALARLVTLERALAAADATVARRQARVRAVAGPVASGSQLAWAVQRAMRPEAVAGIVWEIIPGEVGRELDVDGVERRLREALERAAVTDVGAARARLQKRIITSTRIAELRERLASVAPDGLDALRARAAALGGVDAVPTACAGRDAAEERGALEQDVDAAREALPALQARAERAAEGLERAESAVRAREQRLREVVAARNERAARRRVVAERLAGLREAAADAALYQRAEIARWEHAQARASAERAATELAEAIPQLARDEVPRARGAIDAHRRRLAGLHDEELRRRTLLEKASGDGRFEALRDAEDEQRDAAQDLARITREANAARLLRTVVEDAYKESQRLFLAPVVEEAKPYLARLRPGTEIEMTGDLKLGKVKRRGEAEEFDELSGGTREQLSVIVRLSLARVMARDQRSLPLILDDTMGWTDDARFVSMVQILRDAASELQIILLTCHGPRFDRFQASYAVDLDLLREARQPTAEAPAARRAP